MERERRARYSLEARDVARSKLGGPVVFVGLSSVCDETPLPASRFGVVLPSGTVLVFQRV